MRFKSGLLAASFLVTVAPAMASAQAAAPAQPSAAAQDTVAEVVVTAQKRSEKLSDVPISITALGGTRLASQHVSNMSDLTTAVPNLHAVSTVGDDTPIFALRGVSMSDYSLNQAGPIATYYDEAYVGNFAEFGVSLFDIERVEVLRGPQGTLYGRNSTGGAVNLIAKKPEFDDSGYVTVGYGNYNRREASGAFNAAFGDQVAVRAAFSGAQADGWFKNTIGPALDGTRNIGARLSVLYKPNDRFDAILRLSASYSDPTNYGILAAPGSTGVGAGVYAYYNSLYPASNPHTDYFRTGLNNRTLSADYTPRRKNRAQAVSLNMNWKVADGLTVTSVTSGNKAMLLVPEDTDGSPLKVLEIPYYDHVSQIAQDLRLSYDRSGRVKLIAGAYASREFVFNSTNFKIYQDIDANGDGVVNGQDCLDAFPVACQIKNSFNQEKTSVALYGDGQYKLTSHLTLRGGLRYTDDRGVLSSFKSQAIGADNVVVMNLIPGSTTDLNATTGASFHNTDVSGKVGVDYKTDGGTLFYVDLSRGYRGSGFNAQAFFQPSELTVAKPEVLQAAEAGVKTQLLEKRLQVSVAGFYYDYKNEQFINVDPTTTAQQLLNLPKSQVYGAEIEFVGKPFRTLTLSGGLGLLSSNIVKGSVNGVDVHGHQLANAPKASLSLAGDWRALDEPWGQVALHLDGVVNSRQYFDVLNNVDQSQGTYFLLNGRISYTAPNRPVEVAVWVKNLTDEFYYTSRISVAGFGFNYQHLGEPRTFGVTATYRY
jgi:iron complex outermembrane recepter protein